LKSFPDSNRFRWTLQNQFCSTNGVLNIGLADTIISVKDTVSGFGGNPIKLIVSRNDFFVRNDIFDTLTVDSISSSEANIVLSRYSIKDTVIFITNRAKYGKAFFTYRLSNTCGAKSDIAILEIDSKNVKPKSLIKTVKYGSEKVINVKIPISALDTNRFLPNIEVIKETLPQGVQARFGYIGLDTIEFIVDFTNAVKSNSSQSVQFRLCDGVSSECGELTIIFEPTDFSDEIKVYNALSPNGDGKHDVLEIENILLFPDNKINIFNRWGDKVYSEQGYDNTTKVFDGGSLPDGTYYYVLEPGKGRKIIEGFIVLKR